MDDHSKSHHYDSFGEQYARLGFTDTYYLGFREIPGLIGEYQITLGIAIDHGCGGGRATRFLKQLGFTAIGIDRNEAMIAHALDADPSGDYRWVIGGALKDFADRSINLVFQSSVLEEYSSTDTMIDTFKEFHRVLRADGKVIIITASEELPKGEWASFLYPERHHAPRSGEQVRCIVRNSNIVFRDYYWTDDDLRGVFDAAGFEVLRLHQPLARGDEPYKWLDETSRPPWSVYVLRKKAV
jgi:SAM-dependent methyltransferase